MKVKIRKRKKEQRFRTIVIDPPWMERGGGKIKRGADRHYKLMTTAEIIRIILTAPVWRPDPTGCHLYLWVTNNFLQDGFRVMDAIGFRYITNRVWVKDRFGIGYYFRGQHEIVLFGVYNVPTAKAIRTKVRNIPSIFHAVREEHSRKPAKFYTDVMEGSPGPYLEMFAREQCGGWTSWGDEL